MPLHPFVEHNHYEKKKKFKTGFKQLRRENRQAPTFRSGVHLGGGTSHGKGYAKRAVSYSAKATSPKKASNAAQTVRDNDSGHKQIEMLQSLALDSGAESMHQQQHRRERA